MKEPFTLSEEELTALYNYFTKRAGYISHEFDEPIHLLIRKIAVHLYSKEEE